MNFSKHKLQVLLTVAYLGFVAWWTSFQHVVTGQGLSVQWFGGTYGILALFGAIVGFVVARRWGGFKTVAGRALTYFSLGLLAQELGQLILTYYVYGAKIQVPYPSWGDLAYFGSVIFYIFGAITLSKLTGVKFAVKDTRYKVIAFLVPAVLLAVSYWIFLRNYQYDFSKPVTVGLDFGYPFGEALYLSFGLTAYLLSRRLLGGVMKPTILLLVGALLVQYMSDFTFLYQVSRGTYLAGRYNDLFYLTAYFLLATVMLQFNNIYSSLRRSPATATGETPDAGTERT